MKKGLVIAGVGVVVLMVGRFVFGRRGGFETILERMPESSPPRWMFDNISAIRVNTEAILARMPGSEPAMSAPSIGAAPVGLGC